MSLATPTLRTARLRLRPFTSADADALFALHSSAQVLRYWDAPPWSAHARADRFIAACDRMAEEGSGARLAVDRVCDSAFIGTLREDCVVNGEVSDSWVYGLIRRQWRRSSDPEPKQ